MPAAPLADVIVNCPEKSIVRVISAIQQQHGWTKQQIKEDLQNTLKTDPILLARHVPRGTVTYYVALFDRVVGASRSRRLWKAMGKPHLKVLPFGHYGGVLIYP